MAKRRRSKQRPALTDWDKTGRTPTQYLPVGFPFVTCRPLCPGCPPCADYACRPLTGGVCGPGTLFYPTACLPSDTCLPTVPVGCVPRPCTPS
jgi:hypothetical protein